jgi:hypothetical protein
MGYGLPGRGSVTACRALARPREEDWLLPVCANSARIVNGVNGIHRVVHDLTSNPGYHRMGVVVQRFYQLPQRRVRT